MAANQKVFALWPVSKVHKEKTSFVVIVDGEKGFLRIHPSENPEDAVVIPESVISRIIFLSKSEKTFGRHRVLMFFEKAQPWPFYQQNFSTEFVVFYCRAGDTYITQEQQDEVAQRIKDYEESLTESNEIFDSVSDEEPEPQGFVLDEAIESEDDEPSPKRQKVLNDEQDRKKKIVQILRKSALDMFQTFYAQNVNNYISELFGDLCTAFTSVLNHTVEPTHKDVFFTTFTSRGKKLHCCTSTDGKIMVVIEGVILCSFVLCIRLDHLAAAVFHQDLNGSHHLHGESAIKIFFVPNHDGTIHTFSNFSDDCAERLLQFMQNLGVCNVIYTTLTGREIDPRELDPLRKLLTEDVEAIWNKQEPSNDAQRCCIEIGMQIQEPEPEQQDDENSEEEPEWNQNSDDEDSDS